MVAQVSRLHGRVFRSLPRGSESVFFRSLPVPNPSGTGWESWLRLSARLLVNLTGSPINYADRLIGSPITSQSTGISPLPENVDGLGQVASAGASALRSARLPVNLIGSPIKYANRLIGSPITSQSTAYAQCEADGPMQAGRQPGKMVQGITSSRTMKGSGVPTASVPFKPSF